MDEDIVKSDQTDDLAHEHPEWVALMKGVKFIYANKVAMFMNNWDVRLSFGDENPANMVEPLVGVILSYQQAKALSKMLATNIERLEDEVGVIPEAGQGNLYKKIGNQPEEKIS